MNMIITTKYGIWMNDEEVKNHITEMRAGTAEAACACDTCELHVARQLGYNAVLLPDGGQGLRLVFDASSLQI